MASRKSPKPGPADSAVGQLLIYQDGGLNLQVRLDGQTVWLTQAQIAELFQTTPQNITLHIAGIYEEGELTEEATCKDYLQVRQEGARQVQRSLKHYSLDVILAVGYLPGPPRQLLAQYNGSTAGSITSPSMLQIINCISQGRSYDAVVLSMRGAICEVRIQPR